MGEDLDEIQDSLLSSIVDSVTGRQGMSEADAVQIAHIARRICNEEYPTKEPEQLNTIERQRVFLLTRDEWKNKKAQSFVQRSVRLH